MKKSFLTLFIVSTAFTANATDNSGLYVSAKGGYSFMKLSKSDTKYKFIDIKDDYDLDSKIKDNYSLGGAIGYDFYNQYSIPVRTEIEFMSRGNNSKAKEFSKNKKEFLEAKHKLRLNTFMLNAYYDIKNSTPFTPYIGAGIGLVTKSSHKKLKFSEKPKEAFVSKENSKNIAWSLSAGVQYAITKNLDVDLSYRYFNAGNYSEKYEKDQNEMKSKYKIESNDILLSVAYRF